MINKSVSRYDSPSSPPSMFRPLIVDLLQTAFLAFFRGARLVCLLLLRRCVFCTLIENKVTCVSGVIYPRLVTSAKQHRDLHRNSCSMPPTDSTNYRKSILNFLFILIDRTTMAFLTGQSWRVLKSWYTGETPEQGFWCCFADGLNQSLVSCAAQAKNKGEREAIEIEIVILSNNMMGLGSRLHLPFWGSAIVF